MRGVRRWRGADCEECGLVKEMGQFIEVNKDKTSVVK